MTFTTADRIRTENLVQSTLTRLGCDLPITVEWKALKSRAGDANYTKQRIRFSTIAWEHMCEAQRRNIAIHEACHIAADFLYGRRTKPHGREWKALMVRCGESPDRTWKPPQSFFDAGHGRKRHKRYSAFCGCGEISVTQNRLTRMRKPGVQYRCRRCNEILRAS